MGQHHRNLQVEALKYKLNGQYELLTQQHAGNSFGANTPKGLITPEFVILHRFILLFTTLRYICTAKEF